MELCKNGPVSDFINIHAKKNDFIDESVSFFSLFIFLTSLNS
jgi:hypothetical protein